MKNCEMKLEGDILNTIYKHFVIDSELHFDPFYLGGADTLLYYLRKGRESQRIGFKGTGKK